MTVSSTTNTSSSMVSSNWNALRTSLTTTKPSGGKKTTTSKEKKRDKIEKSKVEKSPPTEKTTARAEKKVSTAKPVSSALSKEDEIVNALFGLSKTKPFEHSKSTSSTKEEKKRKRRERESNRKKTEEEGEQERIKRPRNMNQPNTSTLVDSIHIEKENEASSTHEEMTSVQPSLIQEEEVRRDLDILASILKQQEEQPDAERNHDNEQDISASRQSNQPYILSEKAKSKIGKYLALDCEMVGVGADGVQSILARVSLVNFHGELIYDSFVACSERITDFRTHVSGITPVLLRNAPSFQEVQKHVAGLIKDRVVVGHALKNDFQALLLNHPFQMCRDTCVFKRFRDLAKGKKPSLKRLAKEILGMDIQGGEHSSVEDARAAMLLYKKYRNEWEARMAKANHA